MPTKRVPREHYYFHEEEILLRLKEVRSPLCVRSFHETNPDREHLLSDQRSEKVETMNNFQSDCHYTSGS